MQIDFENYSISPIQEKDAWRVCDFVVSNSDRLKAYFPQTLKENLTPTLAELFVAKKAKQFIEKDEYLFTVKENENRTIMGLVYVKELYKTPGQSELAYAIGYQYKGQGLMAKIIDKVITWSFSEANLNNLQIIVHPTNDASRIVAEKNGFKYQGMLPDEHKMPDGTLTDMQLYELRKENNARVQ